MKRSFPRIQRDASPLAPATAACMGAFDGMHRGHQALFDRARARGRALALVTFDPHPAQVLQPDRAPRLLQSPEQRVRVAAALGIDVLVFLPFDAAMAALEPEAFVQRYIIDGLRPAAIVVGEDFRFGARRAGDVHTLARLLAPASIEVEIVAPIGLPEGTLGTKLSSSDIRQAVGSGDVEHAARLLGRWHAVSGRVTAGARRGRALGFPTANIDTVGFLPREGVYATALVVWDERSSDFGRIWPSVSCVGRNPTFVDAGPVVLETHVLDEDLGERLYDMQVEVSFIARLRDEEKFADVQELIACMHRDVEDARPHLQPEQLARVIVPAHSEGP